jgi:5-deoxy-glucuronate isomerase
MAGPGAERAWLISDDPAQAWVRDDWPAQGIDPRLPFGPVSRSADEGNEG